MSESIVPERLKNRKKRRSSGAKKQLNLIFFTILAIGLIGFGAYYFLIPKQERFTLNFYTYAQVGTQDFLETLTARGTIVPERSVVIEAKIAGTIEDVFVTEGQDVKQGAPLLRLYSQEAVNERNVAETDLSEAKAKLAQLSIDQELEMEAERMKVIEAKEQLVNAEAHLELQEVLYGYGSIPRVELEKAKQNVETAKRRITQSEREMELLARRHAADQTAVLKTIAINEEKLAKAQGKIDNFIVTAEVSGRILSLKIPNNRIVTAHQDLGELADLSSQVVELQVSPGHTERFGLGSLVSISLGQTEYTGEVSYIAPQAKQGQDGPTVAVRVNFLDEVSHLRPNSTVMANIHLQLHQNSPFLPRGAYLTSGQQLFVYVVEGNVARRRDVQFGLLQGNSVQILRGLEIGEKVIISSYDAFRHLDQIEILPEGGHAL
ncbi:MAG: HlyD family efflux transporter periplasmic adaptor subunit [Firmicutes bacterium]|mgnify:CR=1 FL=1|nr:HlyD family efflux transporter periplasmic adaptor subunit [Bacillota bacterium]